MEYKYGKWMIVTLLHMSFVLTIWNINILSIFLTWVLIARFVLTIWNINGIESLEIDGLDRVLY